MNITVLILLLIVAGAAHLKARADSVSSCSMGDYDYKGPVHNDQYQLPATEGQKACLDRQNMDSGKISSDYKGNLALKDALIEKMLNDPQCVDYHELLKTYKVRVSAHADQLNEFTQKRIEIVKEKAQEIDIQRQFAYLGAFNATCSGGHNRKSSFINLDLINKLPMPQAKPTRIAKDGELTESCADVTAQGSDHLKGFFVSLKNAKGSTFNFEWDPYSIPDRVIVKSGSGILYDSGCKGDNPQNLELPVPGSAKIEVNVVNDCENPVMIGSSWSLRIKCQEGLTLQCGEFREELIRLLKLEVEQTKTLIDANSLHRQCLFHIDKDLLSDLLQDGMIEMESKPLTNGFCDTGDQECEAKVEELKYQDNNLKTKSLFTYRDPSSQQDQFRCPKTEDETLFQKVSHAYCRVGFRKLGLEDNQLE